MFLSSRSVWGNIQYGGFELDKLPEVKLDKPIGRFTLLGFIFLFLVVGQFCFHVLLSAVPFFF